jgi:hypothetical protein
MLDSCEGMLAQQAVLTFDSMHAFVDIAAAVLDYKHKTSVDRSDQMLAYYSFERKTIDGGKNFSFIYLTW